jgi:hypothetical protein
MLSPALGGKLRLRLYFRYLCNLDPLLRIISAVGETFQCTQINLILHNTEFLHFVVGRLGLDSYSHEPRTLASWSMTTGWKIDILATKHGRAEKMLGQYPFAADADNDVHQVDWAMAEDGDYDGWSGSLAVSGMATGKESLPTMTFRRALVGKLMIPLQH